MNSFTENNNQPPELQQNLDLLNELPFFSSFPAKAMKLIAYLAARDSFNAGDYLFEEGDDQNQAYLILTGQLTLYKSHDNQQREVRTFHEGDFLGSLSLLGPMPSLFFLKATINTTVITIRRKQFATIVQQFPETSVLALRAALTNLYQWERQNLYKEAGKCCLKRTGATVL